MLCCQVSEAPSRVGTLGTMVLWWALIEEVSLAPIPGCLLLKSHCSEARLGEKEVSSVPGLRRWRSPQGFIQGVGLQLLVW